MGLMLAYNQFAQTTPGDTTLRRWVPPSATVPEGIAGGMGRTGAQKMVIFETDGLPNVSASASLASGGSFSYYRIRFNQANLAGSEYPSTGSTADNSSAVTSQIYGIINQMKTAYSSSRKPLRVHTIGFGPIFDSTSSARAGALQTLQTMQYHGNVQTSASTPLDSFKIITGDDATMATNLQAAIGRIMQGSIQVVLLE
jgi:hypothetical protein